MTLPVNIDATYADDAARPDKKLHQQHHDEIHAAIAELQSGTIGAAEEVTVGPLGTYSTISDALEYLGAKRALFVNGGFTATISLLTGFSMNEQLKFDGVDLGWVTITSVDAEVPIPSENIPAGEGAFYAVGRAVLPNIGCFFRFVTDNDVRATPALRGFDILHGSKVQFTVQAAGIGDDTGAKKCNRLLQVAHGSICIASSGVTLKDGNDIGLRASNGSLVSIPNAVITGCTNNGIAASGALVQAANAIITGSATPVVLTPTAVVEVSNATLTSTSTYAVSAEGGIVYMLGTTCTAGGIDAQEDAFIDARTAVFAGGAPVNVAHGGRIEVTGKTNGTLSGSLIANVRTKAGLILDNDASDGVIAASLQGRTIAFGTTGAGSTITANECQFRKVIVEYPFTFDRIVLNIVTSSGNLDVGVYDHDAANDCPLLTSPKVRLGSTASPGTGRQALTVTSTTLMPGVYWIAYVPDNGTISVAFEAQGGRLAGAYRLAGTFPLPSSGTPTGRVDRALCCSLEKS